MQEISYGYWDVHVRKKKLTNQCKIHNSDHFPPNIFVSGSPCSERKLLGSGRSANVTCYLMWGLLDRDTDLRASYELLNSE